MNLSVSSKRDMVRLQDMVLCDSMLFQQYVHVKVLYIPAFIIMRTVLGCFSSMLAPRRSSFYSVSCGELTTAMPDCQANVSIQRTTVAWML